MSSLGEFLDAMVKLRAQKAQVAEYNASQQMAGMESLGKGFGGLLSGLGQGMQAGQQDVLANQLYNRQNPPRAMAVNQALQGPADIAGAQMPGGPFNAGGPFTGGTAGLKIQDLLDKSEMSRERLANQGELNAAKIGNYASQAEARGASADVARQRLEETARHHQELEAAKEEGQKDKMAMDAMNQTNKKYQEDVKVAHAHNLGIGRALSQAAGAKTQADWEKAVTVITGLYQAGTKQGFKDLPFPEIPPSPDQKAAAAAALPDPTTAPRSLWSPSTWLNPSAADIATQKQTAQEMPGAYQYGGPSEYEMAPEPTVPSTRPQDYYPGGPGSPQTTPAQQQGPPPSAAAPGGGAIPTISLQEARKKNPNITPGLKTDKNGNQILIQ